MQVTVLKNKKPLSVQAVITDLKNDYEHNKHRVYCPLAPRIDEILANENLTLDEWLAKVAAKIGSDFVLKTVNFHVLDRHGLDSNGATIFGKRSLKFSPRWATGQVWESSNDWSGRMFPRIHACENASKPKFTHAESCPSNTVCYYERTATIDKKWFVLDENKDDVIIVLV